MSSVQQQQTLITQVRQVFLALVDQEANDDEADAGDTQQQAAAVAVLRSVLQRMSTAFEREAAARSKVDQLDDKEEEGKDSNRPGGLLEEDVAQQQATRFSTLLGIEDQCGAAIEELFQVAAMWQEIDDDLLECGTPIDMSAMQFACLQQRRRVMRLALRVMDRQIATERKRLRFNGTAATATGGKIPPGQATGGAAARGAGR